MSDCQAFIIAVLAPLIGGLISALVYATRRGNQR